MFLKVVATQGIEFRTHKMGGSMQFENTELMMLIKYLAQSKTQQTLKR